MERSSYGPLANLPNTIGGMLKPEVFCTGHPEFGLYTARQVQKGQPRERQIPERGVVEVLDWTAAALDRVDRPAFFARFQEGEAVPYFYKPFLEALILINVKVL